MKIMENKINLSSLPDSELIDLYPSILKELRSRGIIRTNNLIGELGEYLTANAYKANPRLPNLQLNLKSTKNIDATSDKGERYAIKATSGNGTGVFASLPIEDDGKVYFEYLIIVRFNKDYTLNSIYELTWDQFLKVRRMKPPENKWNVPLTEAVKAMAKKIV
jgi:hypothetical protein